MNDTATTTTHPNVRVMLDAGVPIDRALEIQGQFDRMPHGPYTVGIVETYPDRDCPGWNLFTESPRGFWNFWHPRRQPTR